MDIQSKSDDNEVNKQDVLAMFDEVEEIDFEGFHDDETEFESLSESNPLLDNNKIQSTTSLVGVTRDGANVLMGRKSGVQKRIKDICNTNIVNVHCISLKLFTFLEQMLDFHKTKPCYYSGLL